MRARYTRFPMLRFYKFRQELFGPTPAKDVYVKRSGGGKGWPEECPPFRAANALGYDLLANFDLVFTQRRGEWKVEGDTTLHSDFDWASDEAGEGQSLNQQYAWFWDRGQKLPHAISDDVYEQIRHQVKVSTFLYLATDPNETLLITDVPNLFRPFRAISAVVDTDWYPASYPWHVVLQLDPAAKQIEIKRGEPLARVVPIRRDTYFAQQMDVNTFDAFFERGQSWIAAHGREHEAAEGKAHRDITRSYVKQQIKSRFVVME